MTAELLNRLVLFVTHPGRAQFKLLGDSADGLAITPSRDDFPLLRAEFRFGRIDGPANLVDRFHLCRPVISRRLTSRIIGKRRVVLSPTTTLSCRPDRPVQFPPLIRFEIVQCLKHLCSVEIAQQPQVNVLRAVIPLLLSNACVEPAASAVRLNFLQDD